MLSSEAIAATFLKNVAAFILHFEILLLMYLFKARIKEMQPQRRLYKLHGALLHVTFTVGFYSLISMFVGSWTISLKYSILHWYYYPTCFWLADPIIIHVHHRKV